eukprot:UN05602
MIQQVEKELELLKRGKIPLQTLSNEIKITQVGIEREMGLQQTKIGAGKKLKQLNNQKEVALTRQTIWIRKQKYSINEIKTKILHQTKEQQNKQERLNNLKKETVPNIEKDMEEIQRRCVRKKQKISDYDKK